MHPMTEANLKSAYAGESQAHMRYLAWADKAERDGFPAVARLFRAVSWAEQIHATNHFMVLRNEVGDDQTVAGAVFGYGPTAQNLTGAIGGEEFEVAEMYPAYIAVAKLQGETSAVRSFEWALEAEKTRCALHPGQGSRRGWQRSCVRGRERLLALRPHWWARPRRCAPSVAPRRKLSGPFSACGHKEPAVL